MLSTFISYYLSLRSLFGLFLSSHFTQVLLYTISVVQFSHDFKSLCFYVLSLSHNLLK